MSDLLKSDASVELAPESATATAPKSIARRHDLDALRAIAMLLGIVIHSIISFMPGAGFFWAVQDTQTHPAFGIVLSTIHGFRMPLFFLVSGFFTAMLWRKRGLAALMKHRFKRIFLPLVLSLITIIPLNFAIGAYIAANGGKNAAPESESKTVETSGVSGDEFVGACCEESAEHVQELIARGADVNIRNGEGRTGLHAAVFFGRSEIVAALVDAQVDVEAKEPDGRTAIENLYTPWDLVKGIGGMFRISVTKAGVRDGRIKIAELFEKPFDPVVLGFADSNSTKETAKTEQAGDSPLMAFLKYNPYLGHLWFLWFLCILVLGFGLLASAWQAVGGKLFPAALTSSPLCYLWWIPVTLIPQSMMGLTDESFGPDTSVTFIPQWSVVAYYGIFFLFGALYFDADDRDGKLGRWWIVALVIALVALPFGLSVAGAKDGNDRYLSIFCQTAYAWAMSIAWIGFFRKFMSGENKTMRYISDSSYWLYLAHIPLVMYLQFVVREWSVSPIVKSILVCVVSSVLLLLSYQWFVRYTPIGRLLNGPRKRPQRSRETVSAPA